jgi:hypothetical protein
MHVKYFSSTTNQLRNTVHFMKMLCALMVAASLVCGCNRDSETEATVLKRLDEVKTQIAAQQAQPVRWAFCNKRDVESAIYQYAGAKLESAKAAEKNSPETDAKISEYERLQSQVSQLRMQQVRTRFPSFTTPPATEVTTNADIAALESKLAEAKAPIAAIIDRRAKLYSKFRDELKVENLVAEYARDRFDLVVDSSDERYYGQSKVLFRKSTEVVDITEGVLNLLKEKTK